MDRNRLRVYFGPDASESPVPVVTPEKRRPVVPAPLPSKTAPADSMVTLTLGEMLPTIIDALCRGRGWVEDFQDDKITISRDLYEVLLAYQAQHGRRAA